MAKKRAIDILGTREKVIYAMVKVAKEYGRSKDHIQLAQEIGIPEHFIKAWVARMRKEGAQIPRIVHQTLIHKAVDSLKRSNPELFKR